MNVNPKHPAHPFENLTLSEAIEAIRGLASDALETASISRTWMQKISDDSFSASLARDLLLYSVSRLMGAQSRLQFWMVTNAYATGLTVSMLGTSFTHGSSLLMELIDAAITLEHWHQALQQCMYGADVELDRVHRN